MSDDEFDQLPDPFAGIDWNTIPELSTIPLSPQPSLSHSGGAPTLVEGRPQASTPLANGCDSTPESTQYSFDEWDAAFLAEVNKAEQGILQPQPTGGLFSRIDKAEGTSTRSSSGSAQTSRYFHGEDLPCVITVVHLIRSQQQSHMQNKSFPPRILPVFTPQQKASMKG
jgi:hypothetical protein